ncbi:MAG: hypothetical protein KF817_06740 [Phycisphaeraceae bacterium]|nr:hypothetical protein [Phycisphaeraceae bacterium]
MTRVRMLVCPYCGEAQGERDVCRACTSRLDPSLRAGRLSLMGPWFVRDPEQPFQPGRRLESIIDAIHAGEIDRYTVVRGPTTRQLWTVARRAPGLAHHLGYCHACDAHVEPTSHRCAVCHAAFGAYPDRRDFGALDESDLGWMPPPPAPTGLSAFAPDSDLISLPVRRPARPAPAPGPGASQPDHGGTVGASSASAPDADRLERSDPVDQAVLRMLRAEVERQRRALRWMALGCIFALVILLPLAFLAGRAITAG